MQKNWLVRTNQTITFIPMLIVLFIGIVGYEWLRTELVGSWVLLIAFILLGRFLNLIQAMILSIFIFIVCFIYHKSRRRLINLLIPVLFLGGIGSKDWEAGLVSGTVC